LAQNVELKARLQDVAAATEIALQLATQDLGELSQTDTYFYSRQGRLKLREMESRAELIFYQRPGEAAIRTSTYEIIAAPDPAAMKAALSLACGVRTIVKKQRRVLLWHNVRIHLDRVESLGGFLEFEAVTGGDVDIAQAEQQVQQLREAFGISSADIYAGSYCDLMDA